jgi:predicted CoA-binding protein
LLATEDIRVQAGITVDPPSRIENQNPGVPAVAIVGASRDRRKYGNMAVRAYAQQGYRVFPIHPSAGEVEGHQAYASVLDVPVAELDRVSLYVPPAKGLEVIEEVAQKPVREVWLNPGAESPELLARARALGLNVIAGCSIVAIGVYPEELA